MSTLLELQLVIFFNTCAALWIYIRTAVKRANLQKRQCVVNVGTVLIIIVIITNTVLIIIIIIIINNYYYLCHHVVDTGATI